MNNKIDGAAGVALGAHILDELSSGLTENGFAIYDSFLSAESALYFKNLIDTYHEESELEKAGIGKMHLHQVNAEVRGDLIRWIERDESNAMINSFANTLNELRRQLSRILFLNLKDQECHFTYYPAGKFYKKHIDQFALNQNRVLSLVCYLNHDWTPNDGGELLIYKDNSFTKIEPIAQRLVIFKSELLHEVLTTKTDRYSITGWMLNQPVGLTFL